MMKSLLSKRSIILIIAFITAGIEFNCSNEKNTSSQGSKLVGTWKFISLTGNSTHGNVMYPYSENLYGMLMYDSKGIMSVLLMNPDRPNFASGDMMKGTPEELKAAFEGFDAYCGTYKIEDDNSSVVHHLHGAKFPNWVGTDQIRFFKISNDTLRITAPPILAYGVEWTFKAVLVRL
jgi:hypothetical protein